MNEDAMKMLSQADKHRSAPPYWIEESVQIIPDLLAQCLQQDVTSQIEHVLAQLKAKKINKIILAGRGSSYFLSVGLRYLFAELTDTPVMSVVTNLLDAYYGKDLGPQTAVFIHSTSGKSEGDNQIVNFVKSHGAYTVGVTDLAGSTLAGVVDDVIIGPGGAKVELPATRTYATALMRMSLFAVALARQQGHADAAEPYARVLKTMPGLVRKVMTDMDAAAPAAMVALKDCSAFQVVGFGPNIATADETALALSQCAGVPAANFELENFIHGPLQTLTPEMGVVGFAPQGMLQDRLLRTLMAAKAIGARTMALVPDDTEPLPFVDVRLSIPKEIPDLLSPIVYMVPMWQLAYQFALLGNGGHPDRLSMDKPEFIHAFEYLMNKDKWVA